MQKMEAKPLVKLPQNQSEPSQTEAPKPTAEALPPSSDNVIENLKNINLEGFETAFTPESGPEMAAEGQTSEELLTRDEFFMMFCESHGIAGAITKLESFPVAPNEQDAARKCSDSIYDIALESRFFRFLIEPGNIWIQRAVAIGAYAIPKGRAVGAELKLRKMQVVEPTQEKETEQWQQN